ncbi:MAG: aminoacyl-tRNA deacylase, partial [Terriglobia bacterium]
AQELAARMRISGYEFVKVVVVRMDGRYAVLGIPAPRRIDMKALAQIVGVKRIHLATENEFKDLFPDCELGAMPPFGNLYGLPTVVDQEVSYSENMVINAGTHAEALRLRWADFQRLVRPRVGRFAVPPPGELAAQKKSRREKARRKAKAQAKARRRGKGKLRKGRPKKKARAKKKARTKKKARGRKKVRASKKRAPRSKSARKKKARATRKRSVRRGKKRARKRR